jgi:beta-glucanase (GH16 family)
MRLTPAARAAALAALAALVTPAASAVARPVSPAPLPAPPTDGSRLVWGDNFKGTAGVPPNPAHWRFDTGGGGWGNDELEYYTSRGANAALDGHGHLRITARAEPLTQPGGVSRAYTSARLQTLHTFQFQYGVAQARIEVPAGAGLLPAFWMLGNDAYRPGGWPACGEIDVVETAGSVPRTLKATLHGPWPSAPNGVAVSRRASHPLSAGFHVYGVRWAPDSLAFTLDGAVYGTLTPAELPPGASWPFAHPFFLLLDLAVGGRGSGPSALTPFPATMLVDWVKVWK